MWSTAYYPFSTQDSYGPHKKIDSMKPFDVLTAVDEDGAMSIKLIQGGTEVTSFDRSAHAATCVFGVCV